MLLAGLVAMAAGCAIDLAKFDVLFGYPASEQLLYQLYGFSHINHGRHFSLHFLPSTLQAYVSPGNVRITSVFPYVTLPETPTHLIAHTQLFTRGNTASVPASMPLLFGRGALGRHHHLLPRRPVMVRSLRILLLVAAASAAALMLYGTILERFVADMMPLLVLASMIGMVDIWRRLDGRRRPTRILVPAAIGLLALFGFVASMGIAITPQDNWTQTQTEHYVQAEQTISNITGHPLSGYLVRANSFPSRAPIGQLFIRGPCGTLYVADQAVPNGLLLSDPWLLVERLRTPACVIRSSHGNKCPCARAVSPSGNGQCPGQMWWSGLQRREWARSPRCRLSSSDHQLLR